VRIQVRLVELACQSREEEVGGDMVCDVVEMSENKDKRQRPASLVETAALVIVLAKREQASLSERSLSRRKPTPSPHIHLAGARKGLVQVQDSRQTRVTHTQAPVAHRGRSIDEHKRRLL